MAKYKDKIAGENTPSLTGEEEKFCDLFVYGDMGFAGQSEKCFEEVFGDRKHLTVASKRLLSKPHILARINESYKKLQTETETIAVKLQVAETLKAVMEETATAQFEDKSGIALSPAPLRAVSVNAAKALMDLYPIKHAHETKLKIEGEGGIVFNVIVPEKGNEE